MDGNQKHDVVGGKTMLGEKLRKVGVSVFGEGWGACYDGWECSDSPRYC